MTKNIEDDIVQIMSLLVIGAAIGILVTAPWTQRAACPTLGDCPEAQPCFHDWDVNYECERIGSKLVPQFNGTHKLWHCEHDVYNFTVPAC